MTATSYSDGVVRRDFSGCELLWFAQSDYDFGTFGAAQVPRAFGANNAPWLRTGRWVRTNGRSDVISSSWSKAIEGQASGTFVVQLKKGRLWANLVQANDAFLVFGSCLDASGATRVTLVSIVFVDRVGEVLMVDDNGATVEVVTISARDIGKIFESSATVADPFFVDDVTFYRQAFVGRLGRAAGFSPTETILNVVDLLYTSPPPTVLPGTVESRNGVSELVRAQWRFPGAEDVPIVSFLDVHTFVQAPTFGYALNNPWAVGESGNPWQLLRTYQNACVNEMFVDVRDVTEDERACLEYQEALASKYATAEDAARQKREKRRVWNNLLSLGNKDLHRFDFDEENVGNMLPLERELTREVRHAASEDETFSASRIKVQGMSSPAAVALVFRQRPYDTGSFQKLPAVLVDETEVIHSDLAKSEHNVLNFFRLSAPSIPPELQETNFGIMVSKESIARHGLRRGEIQTLFPFAGSRLSLSYQKGETTTVSLSPAYRYYVWLVALWNAWNEFFWEGAISLHYRPDIRVGTRLVLRRRERGVPYEIQAYVQAVRHNFSFQPGQSQSQLVVTRGVDSREEKNPASGLYWTQAGPYFSVKDPYEYYVNRLMRKLPNQPGSIEPPEGSSDA